MRYLLEWKRAVVAVLATSALVYGQVGDECINAVPAATGNTFISNVGYTSSSEPWSPWFPAQADRWFVFTPNSTQSYSITACNLVQVVDTVLVVYEGSCGQLNYVGGNDDNCGHFGVGARLDTILNAQRTYYIRIGTYGTPGNFEFGIGPGPGAVAQVGPAGCGAATLELLGTPQIGTFLGVNVENTSGTVLIGAGLTPSNVSFCSCTIGHDWLAWSSGSSWTLAIPPNPAFNGLQLFVQGADITAVGSCPANGVDFTSTYRLTIG